MYKITYKEDIAENMKKLKFNWKIDWKSKLIDLLIVIIGISIAFKLNTWNETINKNNEAQEYIESFYSENKINSENLSQALNYAEKNKKDIDTLKYLLISKNYDDSRVKVLVASMMSITDFSPTITTMENITASGEFDLIKDLELREIIINTYKTYSNTLKLEKILTDYINDYATPYFMKNIRFQDFSSVNNDFKQDPILENIVLGYDVLLNQQINGYKNNLERIKKLNKVLSAKINK
ncbi:MAG: hypothetical protein C0595_15150 [Marinilabiliales bacterium]|nr:MAG: hypothetical protein C0595_15150 [Marinilabiliales bacterium]